MHTKNSETQKNLKEFLKKKQKTETAKTSWTKLWLIFLFNPKMKKNKNKKIQKALNFKRFIMKEPSKKEQAAEEVKIHRNI